MSDTTTRPVHPAYGLAALAAACLLAAAVIGAVLYAGLPATLPTHWNAAGQVDSFSHKSFWAVFGTLVIALIVDAALLGAAYAAPLSRRPTVALAEPRQQAAQLLAQQHALVSGLGWLQLVLSAGIAALSIVGWLRLPSPAMLVGLLCLLAAVAATVIVMIVRVYTRSSPEQRAADDDARRDEHWHLGVFYANRADRAVLVAKRYGLGWTVNFGSAGGIAILALLLAVIAAVIVVSVLGAA